MLCKKKINLHGHPKESLPVDKNLACQHFTMWAIESKAPYVVYFRLQKVLINILMQFHSAAITWWFEWPIEICVDWVKWSLDISA